MFALTQKRFDAWIHVHEPDAHWEVLEGFRRQHGWQDVYVSLNSPESWFKDCPTWAIAVPTGDFSHLFVTPQRLESFDALVDVRAGGQRFEDVLIPHQIRLLTSLAQDDVARTKRFLKSSAFSTHLWRVTLEDRTTRNPLPEDAFGLNTFQLPILGKETFERAELVGLEYELLSDCQGLSLGLKR